MSFERQKIKRVNYIYFKKSKKSIIMRNDQRVFFVRENELKNVVSAYALPGNLIYDHENLNMAAERVLKELTGLSNIYLEQFGAFGEPDRIKKKEDQPWLKAVRSNPKARVVTIGYYSLIRMSDYELNPSSFCSPQWVLPSLWWSQ